MMSNKLTKGSNIMWESSRIILPEHREMILELEEELNKVEKPLLDDQKIEEINETIAIAMEDYSPVLITFFENGRIKEYKCHINKININLQEIHITTKEEKVKLKFKDIVGVVLA